MKALTRGIEGSNSKVTMVVDFVDFVKETDVEVWG
jgi:hypothetical protein